MMRIRIRIRIQVNLRTNLIHSLQVKNFQFFLLFYSKKNIRPTPTYWPWGPGSPSRRPPSADCASELSSSTDLSRLLAIFLYPWIRIWIRIKMRIRIRIQRPKNMRIHADPDPDPKHWFAHCRDLFLEAPGNTVGGLQELCVKHGYPMPTYSSGVVGGQPHQRNFSISKYPPAIIHWE